jgi:pimeloyl-ACP methyl ester carboxylesterase
MIHGFGDELHVWEDLAETLAPLFRVVAIDLRGHGDSGWDPNGSYKIQDYVDDVLQLIDAISCGRFVLVGHSLGGEIAIRIAAAQKQSVCGLVLVDFGPELNQIGTERALSDFNASIRTYESVAEYAGWLTERRPLACSTIVARLARNALRIRADGTAQLKCDPAIGRQVKARDPAALWTALGTISAPTLIVRGAGSAVLPSETALHMAKELVNGRLITISCAGHAVMTDNPREFRDKVRSFLAELSNY